MWAIVCLWAENEGLGLTLCQMGKGNWVYGGGDLGPIFDSPGIYMGEGLR